MDNFPKTWKVKFFQTIRGEFPVEDFIKVQDQSTAAKISSYIELLKTDGPYLKPLYIKKLQDKLYELRISGNVAVRILYTVKSGEYYLLHAFKKKTPKTPVREIKVALDRIKEII